MSTVGESMQFRQLGVLCANILIVLTVMTNCPKQYVLFVLYEPRPHKQVLSPDHDGVQNDNDSRV